MVENARRPVRLHQAERAFEVNPYTRWVYEHPRHLLPEPTPAALARLRGAGADAHPLRVELGSGSGRFLVEQAARHPHVHFVGFELRFKRLVKSARKAERLGLRNVWFLREQGEHLFRYFGPGTLDGLIVNFPDPWPKAAQWKKRLVSGPFLDRLHEALRPGGWFQLRTDHSGYFLHVLEVIRARPAWRMRGFSNDLHRDGAAAGEVRSEFEQLFASIHKPIFYLLLEKPAGPQGTGAMDAREAAAR
jgi:tRNA (guanine-N7-)-methyltransferase